MKNLKKALAAVMALSVMSWSCAAFADVSATGAFSGGNGAVTADYSEIAQNKVTATVDTALANLGTEMTFLILDDGTDVTAINEADILYINQQTLTAQSDSFTGVINLARVNGGTGAEELPAGSYPIRVGYYYDDNGTQTFGLAAATMVVSYEGGTTTIEILWGDVNQDGVFNSNDAGKIVVGLTGGSKVCGEYTLGETLNGILWGDVNQDGVFNSNDAGKIVVGLTGGSKACGEFTLGETSEVEVAAE